MVGPWGWAARMMREDLWVSTAAILGFDFRKDHWPYHLRGQYTSFLLPDRVYVPKWSYAAQWLSEENLWVTPTLNVERIRPNGKL